MPSPPSLRTTLLVILGPGSILLGCGTPTESCKPRPDHSVVACLGSSRIGLTELGPYFAEPEPRNGRAELPSPAEYALERALRVRMFAAEAARRGLEAPKGHSGARKRAALYQALVRDELGKKQIGVAHISDNEARDYYSAHPGAFNKVRARTCRAIYVSKPSEAETIYQRVKDASDEQFAAVAREVSKDPSADQGGDVGEIRPGNPEADKKFVAISVRLRTVGEVAGPTRISDGRYVIMRATTLEMTPSPVDDEMLAKVKNLLVRHRRVAALDALYNSLRDKSSVNMFKAELALAKAPEKKNAAPPGAGKPAGTPEAPPAK